jgi:renalase
MGSRGGHRRDNCGTDAPAVRVESGTRPILQVPMKKPRPTATRPAQNIAVIGAGMAGVTCARTLAQAGHTVTVFEKSRGFGGRMATRQSPFGTFDHGVQYFTVRDPRFSQAITTTKAPVRPWSANAVRVLDALGRVAEAALPTHEAHWVATPGMNGLVRYWAQPLAQAGLGPAGNPRDAH